MTVLVGLPFSSVFTFARPIAADCRDATGAIVTRAVNVPRFDHDAQGNATGLIVAAGPAYAQHDALAVQVGDWDDDVRAATVMHEFEDGGVVYRRALYSLNVRATVNACFAIEARHRLIGAVPGFLPNLGTESVASFVRYRAIIYGLGQALGDGNGAALADTEGRVLIES